VGWERRNGRQFYYQSVRVGGRPTRRYLCRGEAAQAAAADVERRRADRQATAQKLVDERDQAATLDQPLADLCRLTDLLLTAALTDAGYHRQDRGPWRKKRHVTDDR
jgi:hypothetical protein